MILYISLQNSAQQGKKMFLCSLCFFPSPSENIVLKHIEAHTKKVKFACSTCNKEFRNQSLLVAHSVSHAKVYCKQCNKFFSSKSNLAEHLKRKENNICSSCSKVFCSEKLMLAHKQYIHGIHGCDMCKKEFGCLFDLKQHKLQHFSFDRLH